MYLRKGISWLSPPFPSNRQPLTTHTSHLFLVDECLPSVAFHCCMTNHYTPSLQPNPFIISQFISLGMFVWILCLSLKRKGQNQGSHWLAFHLESLRRIHFQVHSGVSRIWVRVSVGLKCFFLLKVTRIVFRLLRLG